MHCIHHLTQRMRPRDSQHLGVHLADDLFT